MYEPIAIWRNPDMKTQENNCVEDCSMLGEGFINPSEPFDIEENIMCVCKDGYVLNDETFKCDSCTKYHDKCSKCDEADCLECRDSKYMLLEVDNTWTCVPKILFCQVSFEDQP